jgi:hypothetical protein
MIACMLATLLPPPLTEALARPRTRAAAPGYLRILCNIEGARWVIDEGTPRALAGMTPVEDPVPVTPGSHTIKVSRDGYLPFSDVFDAASRQTVEVPVELLLYSGLLSIDSSPPGAAVRINGSEAGTTPMETRLPVGTHVILLSLEGHVDDVHRITIRSGQDERLDAQLVSEAAARRESGKTALHRQWWFWTIIGAVVVGGVAAGVAVPLTRQQTHPVIEDARLTLP